MMAKFHKGFTVFCKAARRTKYVGAEPSRDDVVKKSHFIGTGSCHTVSLLLIGQALVPAFSLAEVVAGILLGLCVHCMYRQMYTLASCTG